MVFFKVCCPEMSDKTYNYLIYNESEVAQLCLTLCTRLLCPWGFPGKNTGVGWHFLLQGIFPTQGSNPGLLHWRQMLYPLSHQRSYLIYKMESFYNLHILGLWHHSMCIWFSKLINILSQKANGWCWKEAQGASPFVFQASSCFTCTSWPF